MPPLKPLQQTVPIVDLLDDDSDEPEEVAVSSYQRSNVRRTSGAVFKAPNAVLELSDDEDDKNFNRRRSLQPGRRQSLLSSTLIDYESKRKSGSETNLQTSIRKKSNESLVMPTVEPVNTLLDKLQCRSNFNQDVINSITKRYAEVYKKRSEEIQSEKQKWVARKFKWNWIFIYLPYIFSVNIYHQQRRENEYEITSKLRDFAISAETIVLDEEEPEEEIDEFPEFTPENLSNIRAALSGNRSTVSLV